MTAPRSQRTGASAQHCGAMRSCSRMIRHGSGPLGTEGSGRKDERCGNDCQQGVAHFRRSLSEVRSNPNNSPLICDASCSGSRSALTISLAMSETMSQSAGRRAPCAVPSHAHDLYTLLPSEFRAYLGGIRDGQAGLVNAISIQPVVCRDARMAPRLGEPRPACPHEAA